MEKINLQTIIRMPYADKMINEKVYSYMRTINKSRSVVVHKDITKTLDVDIGENNTEC
jgi:hypothetical protein